MRQVLILLPTFLLLVLSCKKEVKALTGDWKLANTFVNGSLQTASDTCSTLTLQTNADVFSLSSYTCANNTLVSLATGEWELINKKKTMRMNFLENSTVDAEKSGKWDWEILELTDEKLTISYSGISLIKYEFVKL